MCREISSFTYFVTCVNHKLFSICIKSFGCLLATHRVLCRVSGVGARPGTEARGHHSLISPPLCLRPRDLGVRQRPWRGQRLPGARRGQAAPIPGQGSKGSPPNTASSNRRIGNAIGNTVWHACLWHAKEIKKAIETQSLKIFAV